ncbi:PIN domain-containing protein [Candidatus Daviesbacteria bacterium]|nr:PIN domain-containing protein [Candidatus Daviesbacteria bacterium]
MIIDSNILVYSIDKLSQKHKKAQQFLEENIDDLEIAHQNIFETLRVITYPKLPNPMKLKDGVSAVERILNVSHIISPNWKTHRIALELIKKYKLSSDLVFDAYLAATALSNGIHKIATDNIKDFQKFRELKIINPFA